MSSFVRGLEKLLIDEAYRFDAVFEPQDRTRLDVIDLTMPIAALGAEDADYKGGGGSSCCAARECHGVDPTLHPSVINLKHVC